MEILFMYVCVLCPFITIFFIMKIKEYFHDYNERKALVLLVPTIPMLIFSTLIIKKFIELCVGFGGN